MARPIIPEGWQEGTIEGHHVRTDHSSTIHGVYKEEKKDWIYIPEENIVLGFTADKTGLSIGPFNEDNPLTNIVKKISRGEQYSCHEYLGRVDLPRPSVYALISSLRYLEDAQENVDISARGLIAQLGVEA